MKKPAHKADRSPPSSVEVINGGTLPPLPHTSSWRGNQSVKHGDNYAFFFLLFRIVVTWSLDTSVGMETSTDG
jgi:hypothetical protein